MDSKLRNSIIRRAQVNKPQSSITFLSRMIKLKKMELNLQNLTYSIKPYKLDSIPQVLQIRSPLFTQRTNRSSIPNRENYGYSASPYKINISRLIPQITCRIKQKQQSQQQKPTLYVKQVLSPINISKTQKTTPQNNTVSIERSNDTDYSTRKLSCWSISSSHSNY